MRARHLLPAALLLAACGGEKQATTDTTASLQTALPASDSAAGAVAPSTPAATGAPAAGAATGSLADASTAAELDSVNAAAKSGLATLSPAVAVPLIRTFENKLHNTKDPALRSIANDLKDLREELDKKDGKVDGDDVGKILQRLGPKVEAIAPTAGERQGTLIAIGEQLTKAGNSLKKK